MTQPVGRERESHMIVMRESGATLEEIGRAFGVTRERVRQLLERNGYSGSAPSRQVDPLKLLAAIRSADVCSVREAAQRCGSNVSSGMMVIRRLGLAKAVQRLFQWRRDWRYISAYRDLAAQLGHTPGVAECHEAGLWQSHIQRRFGGMQKLAVRAGLQPNHEGSWAGRGVRGRPRQSHCKRGHALTPENSYAYRGQRACKACRHLRQIESRRKVAA